MIEVVKDLFFKIVNRKAKVERNLLVDGTDINAAAICFEKEPLCRKTL